MPGWAWVLIIVAIVVVVGLVIWMALEKSRTERLRKNFGPEYDRTVDATSDRRKAEAELESRRRRRDQLNIRPLDPAARQRYAKSWTAVQSTFIDSPPAAIHGADVLVMQVMRDRGYPVEDFDQRAADVSVDHPNVVQDYRAAHAISENNDRGRASTEDLRQAMVHYRALFEELLGDDRETRTREAR